MVTPAGGHSQQPYNTNFPHQTTGNIQWPNLTNDPKTDIHADVLYALSQVATELAQWMKQNPKATPDQLKTEVANLEKKWNPLLSERLNSLIMHSNAYRQEIIHEAQAGLDPFKSLDFYAKLIDALIDIHAIKGPQDIPDPAKISTYFHDGLSSIVTNINNQKLDIDRRISAAEDRVKQLYEKYRNAMICLYSKGHWASDGNTFYNFSDQEMATLQKLLPEMLAELNKAKDSLKALTSSTQYIDLNNQLKAAQTLLNSCPKDPFQAIAALAKVLANEQKADNDHSQLVSQVQTSGQGASDSILGQIAKQYNLPDDWWKAARGVEIGVPHVNEWWAQA